MAVRFIGQNSSYVYVRIGFKTDINMVTNTVLLIADEVGATTVTLNRWLLHVLYIKVEFKLLKITASQLKQIQS